MNTFISSYFIRTAKNTANKSYFMAWFFVKTWWNVSAKLCSK